MMDDPRVIYSSGVIVRDVADDSSTFQRVLEISSNTLQPHFTPLSFDQVLALHARLGIWIEHERRRRIERKDC